MKPKSHNHVFIIEDSKIINSLMTQSFSSEEGTEVSSFYDGESALKVFESTHPNLVFLDYYLDSENKQNMNGEEVFSKLKKIWPDTRVVLLTGLDKKSKLDKVLKCGFDGYINKADEYLLDEISDYFIKYSHSTSSD